MGEQICGHCKEDKAFSDYHKCKTTRTGYLTVCISCRKSQQQSYRKTDAGRAKDKRYNVSEKRSASLYRYWANNPERKAAQTKLTNAVRDGRLVNPQCCDNCGSTHRIEGHHYSYDKDKQLDVFWLCKTCHEKNTNL